MKRTTAGKRALCVGINRFKNYPAATLQGCVNDANDMSRLLQKWFGFKSSDVTVLHDTQATKANIMKNLKTMVDGAKKGDYAHLVFSMSSHGTQVPDLNGEEADRADEAFCPHDLAQSGGQWNKKYIIVDDELHDLFIQLPDNVLLEVYLDTCHSGTGLKAIDMLFDRKPRYLPPPSLEAFKQIENKPAHGLAKRLLDNRGVQHHILWAACRSSQTSADAHIGSNWHGAFTYYFCKEINACKNTLPRAKILSKVRTDLSAGHYTQTPQLECEATKRRSSARHAPPAIGQRHSKP